MTILQATVVPQTIQFVPRSQTWNGVTILDEFTGIETEITLLASTIESYYHTLTAVFPMDENRFYVLKVYNDYELVHYDKVFCTNQNVDTFQITNGAFSTPTTSNDFITYE